MRMCKPLEQLYFAQRGDGETVVLFIVQDHTLQCHCLIRPQIARTIHGAVCADANAAQFLELVNITTKSPVLFLLTALHLCTTGSYPFTIVRDQHENA